jgi:hypothetical protein
VYLVITESDGAHFKAEGAAGQVEELYEAIVGDEQVFGDAQGSFSCKLIPSGS